MRPILNVVGKASSSLIQHQGITFGIARGGRLPQGSYDAVIIDSSIEETVRETTIQIRTLSGTKGLIPLFVQRTTGLTEELMSQTDGYADSEALNAACEKAHQILKRLEAVNEPEQGTIEAQAEFKFLAFLHSRGQVYSPIASRNSLFGYVFPLLGLIFKNEAQPIFKLLEKCVAHGSIATTFKDEIHQCRSCDSNYLNFKECCPKCKSADIRARDMIHHFLCAHVAPQDDFDKGDHLACPKCDKHLRHIGIDYDKPSSIFSCNNCSHEFQNPDMQAQCVDCSTTSNLDELRPQRIGEYSITTTGEQWLTSGLSKEKKAKSDISSHIDRSVPSQIFKLLVNQELKRVQANNVRSLFVDIEINSEQLKKLNFTAQEALKEELSDIIASYLYDADLICSSNYKHFQLLLPDNVTEPERLELIDYNLKKLLGDNLSDTSLSVSITSTTLLSETNLHDLIS